METKHFLFQAFVFLGVAVVMLPIARRLALGSVLGYLLAGIVIGPFVFGFIGEEGEDLMHFAELGVVLMLFIIGLELDPRLLWKLRKAIFGLGLLQVVLTTLALAGIAIALGFGWREALVAGMLLSLSSTAIVLQTLSEKNLLKTAGGQSSFSVLLFQDIAVIPMLALFPFLAPPNAAAHTDAHAPNWMDQQPGWLQALIVVLSIIGIIVSGRYLFQPLLRLIAETKLREAFTATTLFIVVGITVLMTTIGLSAALGTFLAGVVLATSEYRHELESDIEPFKGLLLGLFFIAVGASIDFDLVFARPGQVLGLVVALMLIKGAVLWSLAKAFGLSSNQQLLFGAALCQVGEFAFVLLSVSRQYSLLPTEMNELLVAAVAISMALTPFVILLYEKLPVRSVTRREERDADQIEERNQVIIAGFGHFGNTVGRFLRANGVHATYLDIDSSRVELLRRMGFNVYYGDASRAELLRSAGAESAKILIVAIDDADKRNQLIETVQKHFPHLELFSRASNRYDAYAQLRQGLKSIYRESVDTSLRLGADVLTRLGKRAYSAHRASRLFLKYDEDTVVKMSRLNDKHDSDAYIREANRFTAEIESILAEDRKDLPDMIDSGWDTESLREEFGDASSPKPDHP